MRLVAVTHQRPEDRSASMSIPDSTHDRKQLAAIPPRDLNWLPDHCREGHLRIEIDQSSGPTLPEIDWGEDLVAESLVEN